MRALLLTLAAMLVVTTASASDLQSAYQKEYAYLKAERDALRQRKAELTQDGAQRKAEAQSRVDALQQRLAQVKAQLMKTDEELTVVLREADAVEEARELVNTTLFQARTTLNDKKYELPEEAQPVQAVSLLTEAYTGMAGRIQQAREVRTEPGEFFLTNGQKVSGQVTWLGEVAGYGISDEGSGALVPVGAGRFRLHKDDATATAEAIAAGQSPAMVRTFLFENPDKRIDEAPEKTFFTWLAAGGVVGYVIMSLGVASLLLAALRFLNLMLAGGGTSVLTTVSAALQEGRIDDARAAANSSSASVPAVMATILGANLDSRQALEDAAAEGILSQTPRVERFGMAILVIAAVAPLLGLLGTVTGMIGTFDVITEFGTGDPRMLSGGISEALVTTQMGLIVAIPSLLLGNLLNSIAGGVIGRMEAGALAVINRMPEQPQDAINLPSRAHAK